MEVQTVTAIQIGLGRKFDTGDVTPELQMAALYYAENYAGDFSYMVDMNKTAHLYGRLSLGQAKGVLNCMAAEGKRVAMAAAAPEPVAVSTAALLPGRYTMEIEPGVNVTLRIEAVKFGDFPAGTLMAKRGITEWYDESKSKWEGFAFITPAKSATVWKKMYGFVDAEKKALDILLTSDDPIEYGFKFATETGRCWRCGDWLEVEASLTRGLGPVCAKKVAQGK